MKKLNIEEKAKAYDKALKVLHKYDGAHIMFTQDLKEEMFPELREEYEDERIRKELLAVINDLVLPDEQQSRFIAWLEKQKERNINTHFPSFDEAQGTPIIKQEEPVSEDLEIEIKHCIYEPFFDLDGVAIKGATKYLTVEDIADIARHFANWQKRQDQETIELAEDHAMLAGMEKMKEEMMAKAIDVEVKVDAGGYPYIDKTIELYDYYKDEPLAKKGDKYKVILIKADEL